MFVVCFVDSNLCDELITGREESYRVCGCNCVIYKPQQRGYLRASWAVELQREREKKRERVFLRYVK